MEQQLNKTIQNLEQAIAAFRSIRKPASFIDSDVNSVSENLSETWAAIAACKNAVCEAGNDARSTGWFVDEELWGAVHSTDWHAVADLAEELEEQLDGASKSIGHVEQIMNDSDPSDTQMLANCVVADIKSDILFDGLMTAMRRLSFLH